MCVWVNEGQLHLPGVSGTVRLVSPRFIAPATSTGTPRIVPHALCLLACVTGPDTLGPLMTGPHVYGSHTQNLHFGTSAHPDPVLQEPVLKCAHVPTNPEQLQQRIGKRNATQNKKKGMRLKAEPASGIRSPGPLNHKGL